MNKKAENMLPTYVLLNREDKREIERLAQQEGLSGSTYLRRLVMRELDQIQARE